MWPWYISGLNQVNSSIGWVVNTPAKHEISNIGKKTYPNQQLWQQLHVPWTMAYLMHTATESLSKQEYVLMIPRHWTLAVDRENIKLTSSTDLRLFSTLWANPIYYSPPAIDKWLEQLTIGLQQVMLGLMVNTNRMMMATSTHYHYISRCLTSSTQHGTPTSIASQKYKHNKPSPANWA